MARSKQAAARSKGIAYEGRCRSWYDLLGLRTFDPSGGSGRDGSDIGLLDLPNIRGEAKSQKKMTLSSWLKQAQDQAEAEGAEIGFVQHKRHGIGNSMEPDDGMGNHYVTLKSSDFARILLTLRDHDIRKLSLIPASFEDPDDEGEADSS